VDAMTWPDVIGQALSVACALGFLLIIIRGAK
jgi:hypothetical protein